MGENLHDELAALRTDHRLLAQRVDTVVGSVSELRVDLDNKHKENRKSIHDLRNNDQIIMDGLRSVESFFGDNGAFTYLKDKVEATDKQNRWIIGLILSTLAGVLVNLMKH